MLMETSNHAKGLRVGQTENDKPLFKMCRAFEYGTCFHKFQSMLQNISVFERREVCKNTKYHEHSIKFPM